MSYKNEILKNTGLNEGVDFTQSDVRRVNNRMSSIADKLEDLKTEMEEIKSQAEGFMDGEKNILKGFTNFSKSIDQLDKALQSADKAASAGIGRMPKEDELEESFEYLYEGIRFFKDSKKIDSFLNKLRETSRGIKHAQTKRYMMGVYSSLNSNRRKLKDLEKEFAGTSNSAEKQFFKKKYKIIADEALNAKKEALGDTRDLLLQIGKDKKSGIITEAMAMASVVALVAAAAGSIIYYGFSSGMAMTVLFGIPINALGLVSGGISDKIRAKRGLETLSSKIPEVRNLSAKAQQIIDEISMG